jgi:tetratricopeptide (TPR) repeat protein
VPNHPNPLDLPEAVTPARRERLGGVLILLLLVALFHGPSLRGGFVYDDHWTIVDNAFIRQPANLTRLFGSGPARADVPDAGRPVMLASEIVDHALWGLSPRGYHVQNLLLHLAVALLFFLGLAAVFDFPVSLAAAALFAVHPLDVEAIWAINYREDLLCTLFVLAALGAIFRARRRGRGRGLARLAAFALALTAGFAKENAVIAPILLVILDLAATPADRRSRRLDLLALLGAALLPVLWRAWVFGAAGVVSHTAELPAEQRLWWLAIPRAAWSFACGLGQWIFPWRFSPDYAELPRSQVALGWLAAIAILGLAIAAFRARHRAAALSIAVLAAVAAYLPTLGLVAISNARADRYFYLPSLPLALALTLVLGKASQRFRSLDGTLFELPRRWLVFGVLVIGLGMRARHQGRIWHDDLALWTHATAVQPAASRAWTALAEARLRRHQLTGARAAVDRSLALADDPHAHELRGIVLMEADELAAAHDELARALAAAEPHHRAEWLNNLGFCELRLGQLDAALVRFAEARRLSPTYAAPWLNAAQALERQGDSEGARRLRQSRPRAPGEPE